MNSVDGRSQKRIRAQYSSIFQLLAAEIRHEIWDLASPCTIEEYCTGDDIRHIKPHPFFSTCRESRRSYLHGATYLEATGRPRDAELANILFHFDRDHFRLYCLEAFLYTVHYSLEWLLKYLRKMVVPPDSLQDTERLLCLHPKGMEIRVCLADIPNLLIVFPPSTFRRACTVDLCARRADESDGTYDGLPSSQALQREEEWCQKCQVEKGEKFRDLCPSCL
ncbi:uncharacterized protein FMAN_15297 [Fusarium mangiferae]|uniref:2EXR domain-containing protein n=1 Tax=Fusarium mangiferae TaxID=192010 RepID=A0A1L7UDD6_FUSMA|nr:uncharacterized protein FMAN_15297 [Fusarium mangiferae]CVL07162.1 uncharacterized protein FMAN_15297 [Fusarium mangiferae]